MARPSLLTDDVKRKIRRALYKKRTMEEVADISGIAFDTLRDWYYSDYKGFHTFYDTCNHDRMLRKAERNQEEYLDLNTKQAKVIDGIEVEVVDASLEKIKQDTTKFVQETLNKKHYSKRTENTGKDGGPIKMEELLTKLSDANKRAEGDVDGGDDQDSGQGVDSDTVQAEQDAAEAPQQPNKS